MNPFDPLQKLERAVVILAAVVLALVFFAGRASAENLAVIWIECTSAESASCPRAKYDIPTATDRVKVGVASTTTVAYSTVPATTAIRACVTDGVARGATTPVPWTAAGDPCKNVTDLPASTWATTQTVQASVNLSWGAPTHDVGNNPLTGALAITGYQVFVSLSPIADNSTMAPTLTVSATSRVSTYTLAAAVGSTIYARVKAVNADGVSAFSAQGSKVVPAPERAKYPPGVPTNVTFSLDIPVVP